MVARRHERSESRSVRSQEATSGVRRTGVAMSPLLSKAEALEFFTTGSAARGPQPERVYAHLLHRQPVILCLFDVGD